MKSPRVRKFEGSDNYFLSDFDIAKESEMFIGEYLSIGGVISEIEKIAEKKRKDSWKLYYQIKFYHKEHLIDFIKRSGGYDNVYFTKLEKYGSYRDTFSELLISGSGLKIEKIT